MSNRSLIVRLQAEVSGYVQNFGKAKKATQDVLDAAERTGKAQEKASQQSEQASRRVTEAMAAEAQAAQANAKAKGLAYSASGQLVDANGKVLSSSQAAAQGLDKFSEAAYLVADAEKKAAQEAEEAARAAESAGQSAGRAGGMFRKFGQTLEEVADSARNNRAAWDQAGQTLTAFGAVTVAGLGFVAKAAMDWESAWAGVTKTVDGTPEQMNELEGSLRGLAKTLPLTHEEIAGVAEAAGQLGVAREDVVGFTKTMIDLGESTNLTAEDAATGIAQISNVMGTLEREGAEGVARFGATLVELGNNGASTEADILSMSQRIAGAMATVGGSEVEVLALSNALASMGVRAELGGGVATRVLLKMYSAVKEGGKGLESFATTAGVSASEFAAAFESSPTTAMAMFAAGLNRVKEEGGNVVASLSDAGLKGTETTQVMLALANSGTLLADGLEMGNAAWKANTALLEEASKRYETTESKVKIAWNGIKDAAISAGASILPVIQEVAEAVAGMAEFFGNLPAPVQGALTALAGIAGVGALAAGGFLLVVPRALETVDAFKTLASSAPGAASGLAKVGRAATAAGAIAAVGFTLAKIAEASYMDDIDTGMGNVALALTKVANESPDASSALDDLFKDRSGGDLIGDVTDLESAIDRTFNKSAGQKFNDWGESIINTFTGVEGSSQILADSWKRIDQGLSDLVDSGDVDGAADTFAKLSDQMIAQGASTEQVAAMFPQYADALAAAAAEQESAAAGAEGTAAALGVEGAAAEEAAAASEELIDALAEIGLSAEGTIIDLQKFTDMLFDMGLATMSSRDAAFGWEETLRGMGAAAQGVIDSQAELGPLLNATGTDFNMMTDSGKAANEMMQGIISDGLAVAETFSGDVSKSAADVSQQLLSTYDAGVQSAIGLGLGKDEAIALTRELMGIPPGVSVETWMSDAAEMRADTTGEAIGEIPKSVQVNTSMDTAAFETAGMTKKAADDIPNQETIDSYMSDAAFVEAIRTRAAALGIPESEAIDSFMSSAARNEADSTTAQVLKIPPGASVSAYMDAYIRDMAAQSKAGLDAIDGRRVSTYADHYETTHKAIIVTEKNQTVRNGQVGINFNGGRIPRHAMGGRLPLFGPGTDRQDGILGISSLTGEPTSWVDKGEWVINGRSSEKHNALLAAINRDDPRLEGLAGFARGGRINGLSARPGEANSVWQDRQLRIVESMQDTIGQLAEWDLHEDGSGWIRTMDGAMLNIADGAYTVTNAAGATAQQLGAATSDAHWAAETAKAAGGSFQAAGVGAGSAAGSFRGAGVSASATAGTFTVAGKVTQQAANAIIAATAAVNTAGRKRQAAAGGGLKASAGEANVVWQGRQDQFEQALAKKYGGVKFSNLHEDGSGQIVLDDGRKIELDGGRWKFVSKFKYGAPLVNGVRQRKLSKYAGGGRLPTSGPGTEREDGFLGLSSMTGDPSFYADAGEWIVNAKSSDKHNSLLAAVNRDDPRLMRLPALAGGGRVREYPPSAAGYGAAGSTLTASVDAAAIGAAVNDAMAGWQPMVQLDGRTLLGVMKNIRRT